MIESSDDAIFCTDLHGNVASWNPAAERIFGYTAKDMIGRPARRLVPPEHLSAENEILPRLQAGEKIDHFETVRLDRSGRPLDVAVSISPLRSADGKIAGVTTIVRDTREIQRGQRADLLLAAIVSSSDDAIVSKNLDGIITSWNAGAERVYGYKPEEIIGQSVLRLIPDDRKDEEPKILERMRRGERVDHFETIRVRKNGEHFPVSLTISPVKDDRGVIVGASKIARDITELKRITTEREQLLASERAARAQAEHANRMKDEFLSTISHELRTPLNAILGWTELLESGDQSPEEVANGLSVIKRNAFTQAQLIEDLLDLGRIASGKMTLKTEAVDINAVIRDTIGAVQHSAESKHIAMETIFDSVPHGRLMGDTKRLQQIIWNLLNNAIKFTPDNGRVTVTISYPKGQVQIAIADNGRGIAPHFIPHLFERFRQADASTTRQHGGLGIGLALVKQLTELHGGTVRAESPGLGQGSTFIVSLPTVAVELAKSRSTPGDAPNPILPDLAGIKVLAVDDDRDSLDVIRRILVARKAEVKIAASAEEALKCFADFTPNVVLSDIGMPGQDGYELIRRIRQLPNGVSVPAAALTALARPDDRMRALNSGFQTHVAKPVAAGEIVAVVRSLASLQTSRRGMPAPAR